MPRITVVMGAPASGKSTYVREHASEGDLVVDFDVLAQALGSPTPHDAPPEIRDHAHLARDAVIDSLLMGVEVDAWVIHTRPTKERMAEYEGAGAEFVTVDPGIEKVLEQAEADGRPEWTAAAIRAWYEARANTEKGSPTMRTKQNIVQFKAGPDDGLGEGEFLVYPSTFTRTPDSYGDVVAKGAFAEDIKAWMESGDVLPGLYGHRMDDPDFFVAYALDMGEDDHGWWVKGAFDLESPKGRQVYRLVKGRRLRQLSFAFDVLDEGKVELDDGEVANELRKLKVYEFSFVPVGANQDTSVVAVKALADQIATDVKAGRAISAKNEATLREAATKIAAAAGDINNVLAAIDEQPTDAGKASDDAEGKVEEPSGVKTEDQERPSSAGTRLFLQIGLASAELDETTL